MTTEKKRRWKRIGKGKTSTEKDPDPNLMAVAMTPNLLHQHPSLDENLLDLVLSQIYFLFLFFIVDLLVMFRLVFGCLW